MPAPFTVPRPQPRPRLERTAVRLSASHLQALDEVSKRDGVTRSAVVRFALDRLLFTSNDEASA